MKKLYILMLLVMCRLTAVDMIQHKIVLQVPEPDGSILTRNGELVIRPGARATVILAHGFKHDKSSTKALRVLFPHNTLVFDFRAHGEKTDGQCCSFGAGEVADLKAAADFVKNHPEIGHLPLFAFGASMGASTIIETQAQHKIFDGIIVDSPFESMEDVIGRGLQKVHWNFFGYDLFAPLRRLLERNMFHPYVDNILRFVLRVRSDMDTAHVVTCLRPVNPVESIKKITIPIFLIGCNQDTLTPPAGIKNIYDGIAHTNTQLWLADGKGHVDAFFSHPELYTKKVNDFMAMVIKQRMRKHRF